MPSKTIPFSAQVKNLLRQSGLKARKSLGQHFLIDEAVLNTIVEAAELSPEDTVVEVGPGLGILTSELSRHAGKVIAVELDTRLASLLQRRLALLSNLRVINADILKV
ncbi:MAG: 16S rRNA (adenine(1518)-N(6)/adenine(1519)-N(6))-dimethyltransferase, partial [Dehalococcoidia bacterium]|nr:16S rRNA (adenine(1518)-N(6)/adenine(1519)-N(6))-dimethyltransferase [Dehalococcoidia bacterium]